ncbi:hypothetical protein EQ500_10935 [Lactobacillus sp. XV13L]|nr:hypothetical protein [Lactobacillus sp. XV13L]
MLEQMTLVASFITQLDPLVVIQRQDANNRIGYTHAATAQLLSRIVHNIVIQTYPSKYRAYQAYCHDQAAFVLTNLKIVTLSSQEHIIKKLQPSMVWCLYQIN